MPKGKPLSAAHKAAISRALRIKKGKRHDTTLESTIARGGGRQGHVPGQDPIPRTKTGIGARVGPHDTRQPRVASRAAEQNAAVLRAIKFEQSKGRSKPIRMR